MYRAIARVVSYVELGYTGHQAVHLRAVADAFLRAPDPGVQLSCWLSRHLLDDDATLARDLGACASQDRLRLSYFEDANASGLNKRLSPLGRVLACIKQDDACACYIPYLDACFAEIASLRPGRLETRLSGTFFRPTLHYHTFPNHRGKGWSPRGKSWLYTYVITLLAARRRFMTEILTLDPLAPNYYNKVTATKKFRHLADYTQRVESPISREQLGLPVDRTIFLLAGGISDYKGVREFLTAVRLACADSERFRRKACVVLAGRILESRDLVYTTVAELVDQYPQVPILIFDRRLTDQEFSSFVAAADVVCIPYIDFVGMSSLLLHAAAHEHPVIGPEYGLLGELIRRNQLGLLCNPSSPATLEAAMCTFLTDDIRANSYQVNSLRAFARGHSLENFGLEVREAILRTVAAAGIR